IRRGITVLTKADLVDPETLDVVRLEVEEFVRGSFLEGAPILPVSSIRGEGLDELKQALVSVAAEVATKDSSAPVRLPIDRVFTMKGFGTVVTGTLISGTIRKEQELEAAPGDQRLLRVRGIQVHGAAAEEAVAGQRTALNVAGTKAEELARGMVLTHPGWFRSSRVIDAEVTLLPSSKPMKDRARVHFHAQTAETIATVRLLGEAQNAMMKPGTQRMIRLKLDEPVLLLSGDRFILRQFSPVVTIGGGVVLDTAPMRKVPIAVQLNLLKAISTATPEQTLSARISRRGAQGLRSADALAETGWHPSRLLQVGKSLVASKAVLLVSDYYIASAAFAQLRADAIAAVTAFHDTNPLVAGMGKEALRDRLDSPPELFAGMLDSLLKDKKLEISGEQVRVPGRGVAMTDEEAKAKRVIEEAFSSAGLKVPALKEVLGSLKVDRARAQKIVTLLLRDRVLVKISEDLVFHRAALDCLRQTVAEYKSKSPNIDVARFKDLTGVSRKYAIPLLEYLDRERITRRVGDERVIL
ncbi:MAG TPA: SelB C-terminal domain-containing protein, partial [Terriglobales bacterium]|nr:SelB C-terminal domain-containing protein [Terriglobales bacterium]